MDRQQQIEHLGRLMLTSVSDGREMEIRGNLTPNCDGEYGFSFIAGPDDYSTDQKGSKYQIDVIVTKLGGE